MKNNILFFLLIVVLTIFQLTLMPIFFPFSSAPNLLLMLVIASALLFDFSSVLKWAIVSGLIFDLVSYEKIGVSAVMFVILAYLVSFFRRRFSIEGKTGGFLIVVFLVIISTFSYRLSAIFLNYYPISVLSILKNIDFFRNIFKEIVLNSMLFIPIFYLVKIKKMSGSNNIYDLVKIRK